MKEEEANLCDGGVQFPPVEDDFGQPVKLGQLHQDGFAARRVGQLRPGTDVKILKIFSPKNLAKKWRFLLKLMLVKKFHHNIVF
jgi:hypothetical protein